MATLIEVARRVREEHIENPDARTLIYKQGRFWQFASLEVGGVQWDKELGVYVIDLGNTPMQSVWSLMTGNPYLALQLAVGLLGTGFWVFRRARRTAH